MIQLAPASLPSTAAKAAARLPAFGVLSRILYTLTTLPLLIPAFGLMGAAVLVEAGVRTLKSKVGP